MFWITHRSYVNRDLQILSKTNSPWESISRGLGYEDVLFGGNLGLTLVVFGHPLTLMSSCGVVQVQLH